MTSTDKGATPNNISLSSSMVKGQSISDERHTNPCTSRSEHSLQYSKSIHCWQKLIRHSTFQLEAFLIGAVKGSEVKVPESKM
jgi:hypothetical protein